MVAVPPGEVLTSVHHRLLQGWPGRVAAWQAPKVADRDIGILGGIGRAASRSASNKIDWPSVSSGRRSAQRTPGSWVTINDDRARAVSS